MPVDTTRTIPTRRTQRKITEEEMKDIEMKRIRGELSCAECRRLKLRCDKKVPCGSCCRRGCESICPCGILSAGQGTRFILADTEQLHSKISEMSHRIRQLEDALAILQSTVSDEKHPLLSEELLKIKFGAEALSPKKSNPGIPVAGRGGEGPGGAGGGGGLGNIGEDGSELSKATKQSIDAMGTLTLDDESGEVKYFGQSAGSEAGQDDDDYDYSSDDEDEQHHSMFFSHPSHPSSGSHHPSLKPLANLFPFTRHTRSYRPNIAALEQLERHLPAQDRAWHLVQVYLSHGVYFFRPMRKEEVEREVWGEVYLGALSRMQAVARGDVSMGYGGVSLRSVEGGAGSSGNNNNNNAPSSSSALLPPTSPAYPHQLATLYFILALGALLDLNSPAYNREAEGYYDLGRSALSLKSVFDNSPGVDGVKAVGMLATYHALAGKRYSRDGAWSLMSLAAKLAQSVNRDSARWNLSPSMVEKRRNLFWEVFSADVSHSLALGRPPSIHLSFVDCEFPIDEEATLTNEGKVESGFWRMKHTFAREVFMAIAETTLTAKPASYAAVLNLDRKVREVPIPTSLTNPPPSRGGGANECSSESLKLLYATQHRTVPLLYLHRSFFAQAMLDHPTNPLLSPFSPSFLTAYRSASLIIKATKEHFDSSPEIGKRIWFLLYHTFSAAIIVGTVVTRSPNSTFAPRAMYELQVAVDLFEQTAKQSARARIALNVLLKLKDKANRACDPYGGTPSSNATIKPSLATFPFINRPGDEFDDELAIFGGQKRVIARRRTKTLHKASSSISGDSSSSSSPSPSPSGLSPINPVGGGQMQSGIQQMMQQGGSSSSGGSSYPEVHPMLLQYLNGATFHSPPRQNASIPASLAAQGAGASLEYQQQQQQQQPKGLGDSSQGYTTLANSNFSSSAGATSSNPSTLPTDPSSSMMAQGMGAGTSSGGNNNAGWGGKVEPMPLQISELQYMDWLSSSPSPYHSPMTQHRSDSSFASPAVLSGAPELDLDAYPVGTPPDPHRGPTTVSNGGYGLGATSNDPAGTMVELGVSSESGMDARWMTFVQDCGIMDLTGGGGGLHHPSS
ncbi:hypothetical protein AMATHDRAFT_77107 [Amanita thiersii Skay4041]|uniref:Zn(2)-C6 fungal-type domain-containing protein n=1 Tax=Amanita thiersii Skay4041 TaxID=703135 RepID=A0A2A9NAI3_9AGAR|nr:hypothetical protein AMATHDRAFT_77107 [Amanita thiersii Skay4041]